MDTKHVIHIVDDEEAVRRSVSFLLRRAGFIVAAWSSGIEFLNEITSAPAGCVLLDVRMPDMDGLEVQQELINRGITMPVVVLTGHGDVAIAVRAMKAGAVDFIEKPFTKSALLAAIDVAFERIADGDARAMRTTDAVAALANLSARELDVMGGLVQGLPNKAIATKLGISPRTVEVHRANLMLKLGVRSLSEVLRIAFSAGMPM